jgi:hypothetical protein
LATARKGAKAASTCKEVRSELLPDLEETTQGAIGRLGMRLGGVVEILELLKMKGEPLIAKLRNEATRTIWQELDGSA